jgi:hypothetical protein
VIFRPIQLGKPYAESVGEIISMARRWVVLRMPPEDALKVVSRAISTSELDISALTQVNSRLSARVGGPWYDFDFRVIATVQPLSDHTTEVRIDVKASWGLAASDWGKTEMAVESLIERIGQLTKSP